MLTPTEILKWKSEIPYISENRLKNSFKTCFKTTDDSSIQWLQYRILHRILATNSYLKKINITSSDLCSLCNTEIETISHVFLFCPFTLPIWNAFSCLIYNKISKRIGFSIENVIFGEESNIKNIAINFIILNAKDYIFKCFKKKKHPSLHELLVHLKFKIDVEKCVAFRKQKSRKFNEIWREWLYVFD